MGNVVCDVNASADNEVEAGFVLDFERAQRTGAAEAILADGKSLDDLVAIARASELRGNALLFTRLSERQRDHMTGVFGGAFHPDPASATAVFGTPPNPVFRNDICIVSAGTSDATRAGEAEATLRFHGITPRRIHDVGVAGLWRLLDRLPEIREARIVIAVAGMEGALFSVLAGLIEAPLIAVPTSVGYGSAAGGRAALSSALATCAPGVLTVNIDNGFGAACAALKMLRMMERP
jgi:NCAIR mutase (PurE)-related protein